MPTDTPDQQITLPVDGDTADNPVAFNAAVADMEQRLVRMYTTEADRTARMLVLNNGSISHLTAPTVGNPRTEVYNGSNHISLYTRSVFTYVRKAANEVVNNSTALQNDDALLAALPTAGTYQFELNVIYNTTTVADIKFAFTWPAGATTFWTGIGLATTAGAATGDGTFSYTDVSGTAVAFGGNGAANPVPIQIFGDIVMGGTAGNLQLQWAQQNLEATNTTVRAGSNLRLWRVA